MHRGFLRAAALLGLLAVMAAAGGCVALYTLARAGDRPGDAGGDVGLPLVPPGTSAPAHGDGLPFDPYVTDTLPVPLSAGADTPAPADWPSPNATLPGTPMETEAPLIDGRPPDDEAGAPSLSAAPL
jgi:hypothetical protein